MWFSEAKKHESWVVYDSNHAKMSNICRKIFFSDIGIVDKKQEYTICRRKKKLTLFKILLSCCQWCSKVSAKTTDSCCVCELFAIMFRSEFKLEVQNRFMAPFLVPKIIIFDWIDSGSVHYYFFSKNKSSIMHCLPWH